MLINVKYYKIQLLFFKFYVIIHNNYLFSTLTHKSLLLNLFALVAFKFLMIIITKFWSRTSIHFYVIIHQSFERSDVLLCIKILKDTKQQRLPSIAVSVYDTFYRHIPINTFARAILTAEFTTPSASVNIH